MTRDSRLMLVVAMVCWLLGLVIVLTDAHIGPEPFAWLLAGLVAFALSGLV